MQRLDEMIQTRRRIKRGEHLYRAGQGFRFNLRHPQRLFQDRRARQDGRDQVTGFQMAGLLGLDGISTEHHPATPSPSKTARSARSLLPAGGPVAEIHNLQHHFHKVMSREIVRDHGVMMLLGTMRRGTPCRLPPSTCPSASRPAESPRRVLPGMTREEIGS